MSAFEIHILDDGYLRGKEGFEALHELVKQCRLMDSKLAYREITDKYEREQLNLIIIDSLNFFEDSFTLHVKKWARGYVQNLDYSDLQSIAGFFKDWTMTIINTDNQKTYTLNFKRND